MPNKVTERQKSSAAHQSIFGWGTTNLRELSNSFPFIAPHLGIVHIIPCHSSASVKKPIIPIQGTNTTYPKKCIHGLPCNSNLNCIIIPVIISGFFITFSTIRTTLLKVFHAQTLTVHNIPEKISQHSLIRWHFRIARKVIDINNKVPVS